MPANTRDHTDRIPADPVNLTVIDRRAARKAIVAAVVAVVVAMLAAATIAIVVAYTRIGVLTDDLQQRRAVRDREAQQNVEQRQQGQKDLCAAMRHLVDPESPELRDIRDRYHCPPGSPTPEVAPAPPRPPGPN